MSLPPGFTLEQPDVAPATGLPEGFQLEQTNQVVAPQPTPAPAPSRMIAQAANPTLFEEMTGAVTEPLMKIGSSLIAKPVAEVSGIAAMFSDYLGGKKDGDPIGFKNSVQEALTYQPRTTAGASPYNPLNAIPEAIGTAAGAVGAPVMRALRGDASADSARGMTANAFGEAVPQALGMVGVKNAPVIGGAVKAAGPVVAEVVNDATKSAAFTKQAAKQAVSEADWARAPVIEAGKIGARRGYLMNPSITRPSLGASVNDAIVNGEYANALMSIKNAPKFNADVRTEFGIKPHTHLDQKAYKDAADTIAAPYKALDKVVPAAPAPDLLAKLRGVGVSDVMGTDVAAANAVKTLASSVEKELAGKTVRSSLDPGLATVAYPSTNTILKTISDMRLKASDTFNSAKMGQISSSERAIANARRDIADILEQHLETIAPKEMVPKMQEARVKLAQLRKFEDATNFATGQVFPEVFAKEMAGQHNLTGLAAEMGTFAANLPEFVNVAARKQGAKVVLPSRSGVTGTLGYVVGTAAGGSGVAGSAIGAGVGSLGGKLKLKKMLSEEFQKKNAAPLDRRIMPTQGNGMLTGGTP